MLVGLGGIKVFVFVGRITVDTTVLVATGVFVGRDVTGTLVSNDEPGVRKTLSQAGCVRMDRSRGSSNSLGRLVRKSLFGSMFDLISVFSFQVGAKRIAHPPARITHKNPNKRMIRMIIQSRLSFS